MRIVTCVLVVLIGQSARAADPPGGERYYVLLFGGQGDILRPRTAHTWATFARTVPTPGGAQVEEAVTISWLPATLKVRPFALRPETGVNLSLQQTLDFIDTHRRSRVAVFGPYEIPAERFDQAVRQRALLESGAIKYQSLGMLGRRADVMHCIDGVTRMDAAWEDAATPSTRYGAAGAAQTVRAGVRSGFIPRPAATHPEVLPQVNAGDYPLVPKKAYPIRER